MATAIQIVKRYYPDVTSVVDAKKAIKVEVTRADANSRAVKNHKECAMAVACKRQGADGAIICVKVAYLIKGTKAIRYSTPESVGREIISFDRNAGFEPGTYSLAAVPPSNEIGVRRKPGHKSGSRTGLNYHRTENVRVIGE